MERIGVQVGDVIQVSGKRATAAKVMPTYPEDRGRGVVQMDGILRENAQCGLGEKARIEPAACQEATGVVLVPLTP
jgi:transitional endoplasmic reticulum ATPase